VSGLGKAPQGGCVMSQAVSHRISRRLGFSSRPVCLDFFMNKVGLRLFVFPVSIIVELVLILTFKSSSTNANRRIDCVIK